MKLMFLSDGPLEVGCFKTLSSYESTADLIDVTHEKCINSRESMEITPEAH